MSKSVTASGRQKWRKLMRLFESHTNKTFGCFQDLQYIAMTEQTLEEISVSDV